MINIWNILYFVEGWVYCIYIRNDLIYGVGYDGNVNVNIGWNCVK